MAYFITTDNPRIQGAVITSGMPQACRWAKERSAAVPNVTFTVTADGTRREGYFDRDGAYIPGPHGAGRKVADYRDGEQVRAY